MKTRDTRKSKFTILLTTWLYLLVGFSFSLQAQNPGDQYWSDEFSVSGTTSQILGSSVQATYTTADGIYVAGNFSIINGILANNIAYFDGTDWHALGEGLTTSPLGWSASVKDLYLDGDKLFVAGDFTSAGSVAANNIAVWDINTKEWSAVGSGSTNGADGQVNALEKIGNKLYMAGDFSNAGGSAISNITYWDGSSFNAVGSGIDGSDVRDIEVINNKIYAVGKFYAAGGNSVDNMAVWDGADWSEFAGGSDFVVNTIAAVDTSIYVGGEFTKLNSNAINYIGQWDGTAWNAMPTEPDASVYHIKDTPNGLLVAGYFTEVGITEAVGIARWSGSGWEATDELFSNAGPAGTVRTIGEYDGKYVLGGEFIRSDSYNFNNIAALNSSMELSTFHASPGGKGIAGDVNATAVSGSDVYVGGSFIGTNTIAANNIAKWNGADWEALGEGIDGTVSAILIDGNKVYVAGDFSKAGTDPAANIAVWDTQTETWSALGSGTDDPAGALLKVGSKLYAAGRFTKAGGNTVNHIAVWDGSSWANLGSGTDNNINSLALMGGTIVAAGNFTTAGGNTANNIAAWNGSSWSAIGTGTDLAISDLAVVGDSVLYAAGNFTTADGNPAKRVAKWDGTAWEALGAGLDDVVASLHVANNKLYAGGQFQNSGVTEIAGLASWNGTSWEAVGSGLSDYSYFYFFTALVGNQVRTMSVTQDNQLVIGGNFSEVGGKPASAISMYDLDEPALSNETETELASDFTLEQNYPNPFNPSTNITYKVPSQSPITLKVYNMLGQEVATLVNSVKTAGSHTVSFDASKLSSGMYIYRLTSASTSITKKMMLLK